MQCDAAGPLPSTSSTASGAVCDSPNDAVSGAASGAASDASAVCQLLVLLEKQGQGDLAAKLRSLSRPGAPEKAALLPELAILAADEQADAHVRCASLRAMAQVGLCSNEWLGAQAAVQYADAPSAAAGRPRLAAHLCASVPRQNTAVLGDGQYILVVMRNGRLSAGAAAAKRLRACVRDELGISARPMRFAAGKWDAPAPPEVEAVEEMEAAVLRRCVRPAALLPQSLLSDDDAHQCLQARNCPAVRALAAHSATAVGVLLRGRLSLGPGAVQDIEAYGCALLLRASWSECTIAARALSATHLFRCEIQVGDLSRHSIARCSFRARSHVLPCCAPMRNMQRVTSNV
jgi:hypothetical protein